jgi:hypothetical protein
MSDLARESGPQLLLYPHQKDRIEEAVRVAVLVDRPNVGVMFKSVGHRNFPLWYNPGNIFFYSGGKLNPIDDDATVDSLVVGMSAKDFRPPKEVMVTPGTGQVDFPYVLARRRQGAFGAVRSSSSASRAATRRSSPPRPGARGSFSSGSRRSPEISPRGSRKRMHPARRIDVGIFAGQ